MGLLAVDGSGTHTAVNPVLCPLWLLQPARSFPSRLPQSFHGRDAVIQNAVAVVPS